MEIATQGRRRERRAEVKVEVLQHINDQSWPGLGLNVSSSGLYFEKQVQPLLKPGDSIVLEFTLPGDQEPIWAYCEVMHTCLEWHHGTGVRFDVMPPRHRRRLAEFVGGDEADPPQTWQALGELLG